MFLHFVRSCQFDQLFVQENCLDGKGVPCTRNGTNALYERKGEDNSKKERKKDNYKLKLDKCRFVFSFSFSIRHSPGGKQGRGEKSVGDFSPAFLPPPRRVTSPALRRKEKTNLLFISLTLLTHRGWRKRELRVETSKEGRNPKHWEIGANQILLPVLCCSVHSAF